MSERFVIAYVGPAVDDGTMDVRQLAPALLSVGKLIEHANTELNGDRATVAVRVRTGTPPGSFPVDLELLLGLSEQIGAMLGSSDVQNARQLLGLIGFLGPVSNGLSIVSSLLEFLKLIKGRSIRSRETLEDGNISIQIEGDNNDVVVNKNVIQLVDNSAVHKDVYEIMRPVRGEDVDEFQVREGDVVLQRLTKDDVRLISPSPSGAELQIEHGEETKWVTVRKSWFVEDHIWQFHDGTNVINASMEDPAIWEQIHSDQMSISEHTQLRVRIEWTQERTPDGVTMEQRVVEVLDRVQPPVQGDLLEAMHEHNVRQLPPSNEEG